MTARLIDDHAFVLTGEELVHAHSIITAAIKILSDRDGGAVPTLNWLAELRRGANVTRARFAAETRTRTFEVIEAESSPEGDRSQEMNAVEAAEHIGITEQYCRRIRHKIGLLREKPITFDRQMVEAYALAHPLEERSMTRQDPNLMTGDQITRGVDAGRHPPAGQRTQTDRLAAEVAAADRFAAVAGYQPGQPINDLYRQRTYQALLSRGMPTAEAQNSAEFWARLKASAPEHVFGPADDILNPLAALSEAGNVGSITTDPITGTRTYQPGYQPSAAATSLPAGGPPMILEYTRNAWFGMSQPINRFSLNPGAEVYAAIPGPAPTMFGAGDLPVLTGSGVDPSILRWVAWPIRHTAAFTESRARVTQLIELSLEGDPEGFNDLMSPDGRAGLETYYAKIVTWVNTLPVAEDGLPGDLSVAEIDRLYGPEGTES